MAEIHDVGDGHDHAVVYVVGWSWTNDEPNLPSSDWDGLAAYLDRPAAEAHAEHVRLREHEVYLRQGNLPEDDDPCSCGPEVLAVALLDPAGQVLGARPVTMARVH